MEHILWIKDDDADDILWEDGGEPMECDTDDGSLAILAWVANELNPEHNRWSISYDLVVRDQLGRLWMRGYDTPATEQQESRDRWTYDTKPREDGPPGRSWHTKKWVGFRPAKEITRTITDYIPIKEHK